MILLLEQNKSKRPLRINPHFSESELKKALEILELSTFNNWLFFRMCPKDLIHLIKEYVHNYTWKVDWLQKTIPVGLSMLGLIEELSLWREDHGGLDTGAVLLSGEKNVALDSTSSNLDSNNLQTVSTWIICYDFNERRSCVRLLWSHFKDLFKLYEVFLRTKDRRFFFFQNLVQ